MNSPFPSFVGKELRPSIVNFLCWTLFGFTEIAHLDLVFIILATYGSHGAPFRHTYDFSLFGPWIHYWTPWKALIGLLKHISMLLHLGLSLDQLLHLLPSMWGAPFLHEGALEHGGGLSDYVLHMDQHRSHLIGALGGFPFTLYLLFSHWSAPKASKISRMIPQHLHFTLYVVTFYKPTFSLSVPTCT